VKATVITSRAIVLGVSLLALLPAAALAAIVVCEPQGGINPFHPPTYWYDVTPQVTYT
jgi:hypothetical protein